MSSDDVVLFSDLLHGTRILHCNDCHWFCRQCGLCKAKNIVVSADDETCNLFCPRPQEARHECQHEAFTALTVLDSANVPLVTAMSGHITIQASDSVALLFNPKTKTLFVEVKQSWLIAEVKKILRREV